MAQPQVRRNAWEGQNGRSPADLRATDFLHLYIYDYCKKRNFQQTARTFAAEAGLQADQVPPIDIPSGFLSDWWGVFWDVYNARHNDVNASKEAVAYDQYNVYLRARREEIVQQHRNFNMQTAQQQQQQQQPQQQNAQQVQQPQQQQAVQQQTPQAQQQNQQAQHRRRRASEVQRQTNSPQQQHPLHHPLQQQAQHQQPTAQTPHLQSVPSQQGSVNREARPSPASSTTSLPNSGMPHPNSNVVNTPQSVPASLPQQHISGRPVSSPSFSPQQMQRPNVPGSEPMNNPTAEHMMNSPMIGPQGMIPMNVQAQQAMNQQRQLANFQNAAMIHAMNALGFAGRDFATLTPEQKNAVQARVGQIHMMRNPNIPPSVAHQARMQQVALNQRMLQQQQQQQQGMDITQAQTAQAAAMSQSQVQQHAMDMANRNAMMSQPGNGQIRATVNPSMAMTGAVRPGQMGIPGNMPNPNVMGNPQFAGDAMNNMMIQQQMMSKGQMPPGFALQQQRQQQLMRQQQQQMFMDRRLMQQQMQAAQVAQNMNPMVNASQPTMMTATSPQDPKKLHNEAVADYKRKQVEHIVRQQQQFSPQQTPQQLQSQGHPSKRQRHNPENEPTTPGGQPNQSPPIHSVGSPQSTLMNTAQSSQAAATMGMSVTQDPSAMAMQARLAQRPKQTPPQQQQRTPYSAQEQGVESNSSPQVSRNNLPGPQKQTPQPRSTPTQTSQVPQARSGQQQHLAWSTAMEMDSPVMAAVKNEPTQSQAAAPTMPNNSAGGTMTGSFDLEKFMMSDGGDFGEIFAAGDDGADQNLLMGGDFGSGFLASMGGLGMDNALALPSAEQTLQPYGELQGHSNKVLTCAFSANGQYLASAGHDKRVLIWAVQNKQTVYSMEGHTGHITCVRWSPDNRNLVATCSFDKTIRIWNVGAALNENSPTVETIHKFDCRENLTAVDFAPGRPEILCSIDAEGELKVWNLNTGKCEKTLRMSLPSISYSTNHVRFHPRESNIVACAVGNHFYTINISTAKNNSSASSGDPAIRCIPTDHTKNIVSIDWSADGNYLVVASDDLLGVFDTSHWKLVASRSVQAKISSFAYARGDGQSGGLEKLVVVYGEYEAIYIWHCGIPSAQPKRAGSQSGMVASIACTLADSTQVIASASHHKEKNLMLWTL